MQLDVVAHAFNTRLFGAEAGLHSIGLGSENKIISKMKSIVCKKITSLLLDLN